jgi:uncharacterized protein DUF5335
MNTYTIPEDRWIQFFDEFSREHAGWAASIEVLDGQSGPQNLAKDLPLQGFSFDTQGSRPCTIEISAGDQPGRQVTHVIDMPLHIRQATETTGNIDIQIEPARGPTTLIHLHAP